MCHTIAGTPAGSSVGPYPTHVTSRRTLAAGTGVSDGDARSIAAYLYSLR